MKELRRGLVVFICFIVCVGLVGCGMLSDDSDDEDYANGELISIDSTELYPAAFVTGVIAGVDATYSNALTGAGIAANYPVTQYNITYETLDASGSSTEASAAVFVPSGVTDPKVMIYGHGTTTLATDAPTNTSFDIATYSATGTVSYEATTEALFSVILASSDGYVVIMPDYLGFGESSGFHPYIHADSLATTMIDSYQATEDLASSNATTFTLGDDIFLAGYSEGGFAAMAAHKELTENSADYDFTATASFPGSGPYDMSNTMTNMMLTTTNYTNGAFLPYIIFAYEDVYDIYDSTDDYFKSDYTDLRSYYDGTMSISEINPYVPDEPISILLDSVKAGIQSNYNQYVANSSYVPTDNTYAAVLDNDIDNWTPQSYVFLLHCFGDSTVPVANSQVAYDNLAANSGDLHTGGKVTLIDPYEYSVQGSDAGDGIPTITDHSTGYLYYILLTRGLIETYSGSLW